MTSKNLKRKTEGVSGFDTLFSDIELASSNEAAAIWIPFNQIRIRKQPRRYFDLEKIEDLTRSFQEHGFKGTINVRPLADGTYELVAGERRYRAAQRAGLQKVACLVHEYTEKEALKFSLVENLLRENLSKLEETEGILNFMELELGLERDPLVKLIQSEGHHRKKSGGNVSPTPELGKIEQILNHFGIQLETFRTKNLRVLNLPEDVKQAHLEGKVSSSLALEIGKLVNDEDRTTLLEDAIDQDLSAREVKQRVKTLRDSSQSSESQAGDTLKNELTQSFNKLKQRETWKKLNAKQRKKLERVKTLLNEILAEG